MNYVIWATLQLVSGRAKIFKFYEMLPVLIKTSKRKHTPPKFSQVNLLSTVLGKKTTFLPVGEVRTKCI